MPATLRTAPLAELRDPRISPADLGECAAEAGFSLPYKAARHHQVLAREFVEAVEGRAPLLVAMCGVQQGKSRLFSILGSAFALGIHPDWNVIVSSYATEFSASRIGAPARNLYEKAGPAFYGHGVDPGSSARDYWETTAGGSMYCAGTDRSIAGRPANGLILDDVVGSPADCATATQRANLWTWYTEELQTRRHPSAFEVVIGSRFRRDDFIGMLLENAAITGHPHRVIDMPALAVCSVCEDWGVEQVGQCGHGVRDALGRLPGEALWPEVRPRTFLLSQLRTLGTRSFGALFQCRPSEAAGDFFQREWMRFATRNADVVNLEQPDGSVRPIPLAKCPIFAMVDLAASQTTRSDYFVMMTFAIAGGDLIVLDVVRERATASRQRQIARESYAKWRHIRIGVESVGFQAHYLQMLVDEDKMPAVAVKPSSDKVMRATVAAARMESGQIYFVRGVFTETLVNELLEFPNSKHDDQVDCLAYGANAVVEWLQKHGTEPMLGYYPNRGYLIG